VGKAPGELVQLAMILNRTPMSPLEYERPDDAARRALGIADNRELSAQAPRRTSVSTPESPVFQLRISLREVEPEIWRTVQVRNNLTGQSKKR